MKSKSAITTVVIFLLLVVAIISSRYFLIQEAIANGYTDYSHGLLINIAINLLLISVALLFINKHKLHDLGGIGKFPIKKAYLAIPVLYVAVINLMSLGSLEFSSLAAYHIILFIIFCLSIGYSEELAMRSFLQSFLLKHNHNSKKDIVKMVVLAAFIFGVLHLIKFDKGLWGELTQVLYATFLGVVFGALVLVTNRIWPSVVVHALIDIFAKFDDVGKELTISTASSYSWTGALLIALLILPCLFYGFYLLKRISSSDIEQKLLN